jgi:serine/threonine protein phosphatase PrpC
MRKSNSDFNSSFISEAGTFIINKGYFAYVELDDIACWIAADGLDSDEAKESAKIAVHRIFEDFMEKPTMSPWKIKKYILNAHNALKSESRNIRLKAGLVMLITDYSRMIWAVAGNARLYHFRKGIFNFRSKDLSIAQLLADSGQISEAELNEHDERHNLTGYLGKTAGFKPFVSWPYRLADGDVMLLCNAGFWENMTIDEISAALQDTKESAEFVDNLEETLLGKQNETLNNYTIAAVFSNKVFRENTVDYGKIALKAALVVIPIILTLAVGLLLFRVGEGVRQRREQEKMVKMEISQQKKAGEYEKNGDRLIVSDKYQEAAGEYQKALQLLTTSGKDPEKAKMIETKYDITLLVTDGDKCSAGEDYSRALEKYIAASQKAVGQTYNPTGIKERISKTRSMLEMGKLVKEGDDLVIRESFAVAEGKYALAKRIAAMLSLHNMVATLDAKISSVGQQKVEMEKRTKLDAQKEQSVLQAKHLEADGDAKYKAKNYKGAVESYQMAKRAYEGLNMTQELLVVEEKLKNAANKARPAWKKMFGVGKMK